MTEEAIKMLSGIKEAEEAQRAAVARAKAEAEAKLASARADADRAGSRAAARAAEQAAALRTQAERDCGEKLRRLETDYAARQATMKQTAVANLETAAALAWRLFYEETTAGE